MCTVIMLHVMFQFPKPPSACIHVHAWSTQKLKLLMSRDYIYVNEVLL